jgi:BolA protein
MMVRDEIAERLQAEFQPKVLDVLDESEQHIGHAGYREGGQSHFRVVIAADAFAGMGRIARHRAVHNALGPELVGRIHALSLQISA